MKLNAIVWGKRTIHETELLKVMKTKSQGKQVSEIITEDENGDVYSDFHSYTVLKYQKTGL